jgi:uncharacterized NAD-dependent epimerase/dehydratase family protein
VSAAAAQGHGPYLIFLGDITEPGYAKTAMGLRDWAPDRCIGELGLGAASVSVGLPKLSPAEAYSRGARALLIGVATPGGLIPGHWIPVLIEALNAGLDIVSGMHAKLSEVHGLVDAASRAGCRLIDIRVPPADIPVGTGLPRSGRRLLMVGTDCALGKKYTALAIARSLRARGADADFRATGQTGIMIAGSGTPIDSVVADFLSGAAEMLSPAASPDHIDVIEGQGSLFHPAYAAVSLGLLLGSQPDMFVVCHQPSRTHVLGYPAFRLPSIEEVIERTVALGKLTNSSIRCVGVSLNTGDLAEDEALHLLSAERDRLGLPVADPIRGGPAFGQLVDACVE